MTDESPRAADATPGPGAADFRRLFEAAPGAFLVLLPDAPRFTVVAATARYLAAAGVAHDAVVGRALADVVAGARPDDPACTVPVRDADGAVRYLLHRVDDGERRAAEGERLAREGERLAREGERLARDGEREARAASAALGAELRRDREELRALRIDAAVLREHSDTLRRGLRELVERSERIRGRAPPPPSPPDAGSDGADGA